MTRTLPSPFQYKLLNLAFPLFCLPSTSTSASTLSHSPEFSVSQAVAAPISPTELKAPADLHGFELLREEYVAEYDAKVFLFKHEKTGAEVMSLSNDDENKTFGITFRTPPANSTGIPHILEHSVLCGSRKYPIKEPFVELIKVRLRERGEGERGEECGGRDQARHSASQRSKSLTRSRDFGFTGN